LRLALRLFNYPFCGEAIGGSPGDLIASMLAIPLFRGLNRTAIVLLGVIGEKSEIYLAYLMGLALDVSTVRPGALLIEAVPGFSCEVGGLLFKNLEIFRC
jgi:hypothetical protein